MSVIFENNILITNGEPAYFLPAREHVENGGVATGNNLLWSVSPTEADTVEYCGVRYSFEKAQALGLEAGSVYANPKCRDIEKYDFALEEDSPAYKLGFQTIEEMP